MRKFKALPVAGVLFLASAAAAHQSPPAPPAAAAADGQRPQTEKPICRSETPTGSRFPKRVCHTKAEWSAMTVDGAAALEASRRPR
jgi:hypothetical protein